MRRAAEIHSHSAFERTCQGSGQKESSVVVNGMSATDKRRSKICVSKSAWCFNIPNINFCRYRRKGRCIRSENMKLEKDEIDRRVRRAIEVVGLDYDTFAHRSPFDLSGGENAVSQLPASLQWNPKFSSSTSLSRDWIRKAERRFSPLSKNFKRGFSDGDYGVAQHGRHCGDR